MATIIQPTPTLVGKEAKEFWKKIENTHEAIISKEVFDKVQEIKKLNRVKNFKCGSTKKKYYGMLEGKLFCKECGRKLFYVNPLRTDNSWGSEIIEYNGLDQIAKRWTALKTYGGKLTENIVQAVARDCLAESIRRIKSAGFDIVMHIHDEIVVDAPKNVTVEEICSIMNENIEWAPGLLLRADGFESEYYKKD